MSQKFVYASIVMGSLLINSATITSSAVASHPVNTKKVVTSPKKPEFVLNIGGENITWDKYLATLEESPTVNEIFQNRKNAAGFAVLENLAKETALIHVCKKKGIHVTPAEVQKKFDEIKKGHPDFEKLLKASSVSENHMKRELMIQQYEYKFITFGIVITEKDIAEHYQKNIEKYTKYKLRLIFLSDESKKEEVDKKIKEGTKFEDVAKEFSAHPSKNEGGSIPLCLKDELPPELKKELDKLKTNEISDWIKLGNKSLKLKLEEVVKQSLDQKLKTEIKGQLTIEKGSRKNNLTESIDHYLVNNKINCLYGKYQPRFNQFIDGIKQKLKAEKEAKIKEAEAAKEAQKKKAEASTETKKKEAEIKESKMESNIPEKVETKSYHKEETKTAESSEHKDSEKSESSDTK